MQNRGYSGNFIQELKNKCDIVGVISKYIRLEQKGSKYWGCCPFHHEKTPSFCIDMEGFYHCFGCKESGDVITFVQKMENIDFIDAVKRLAESVNLELPELTGVDDNLLKKKKEKEIILKVLDASYKHYESNLYLSTAKKAQDYVKLRKFTKRELDDFKIGYSNNWIDLINHLKKQGFSFEDMVLAGVAGKKDGSNHYYDVLGERLVFPIFNSFSECVGFSARVLEKTDYAKYKNTAETLVFKKNELVYGIHLLKKLKNEQGLNRIILVEGQIDVIAMHRAGFKEAVACLGTALTENHARQLKKYCDNIVICFDGDGAGEKATLRAIEILRHQNLNIKIVKLPEKSDPDEIINKQGNAVLEEYINNAYSVTDYIILLEKSKFDLNKADEKGKFVKILLDHLKSFEDASSQEPYLEKIRDLTNIPIDVLRKDLNRSNKTSVVNEKDEKIVLQSLENGNVKAEKYILSSILHKKSFVITNLNYSKLLNNRKELVKDINEISNISALYDIYDVASSPFIEDIIVFDFNVFKGFESEYFKQCVWTLAEIYYKKQIEELSVQCKQIADISSRLKCMAQIQEITNKIKAKSLEEFND